MKNYGSDYFEGKFNFLEYYLKLKHKHALIITSHVRGINITLTSSIMNFDVTRTVSSIEMIRAAKIGMDAVIEAIDEMVLQAEILSDMPITEEYIKLQKSMLDNIEEEDL